jgi:hypothetical protein
LLIPIGIQAFLNQIQSKSRSRTRFIYDKHVKKVTGEKDNRAPAQPPALRELVMNFQMFSSYFSNFLTSLDLDPVRIRIRDSGENRIYILLFLGVAELRIMHGTQSPPPPRFNQLMQDDVRFFSDVQLLPFSFSLSDSSTQCWGSKTCWCGSGSAPVTNGSGSDSGSNSFL